MQEIVHPVMCSETMLGSAHAREGMTYVERMVIIVTELISPVVHKIKDMIIREYDHTTIRSTFVGIRVGVVRRDRSSRDQIR